MSFNVLPDESCVGQEDFDYLSIGGLLGGALGLAGAIGVPGAGLVQGIIRGRQGTSTVTVREPGLRIFGGGGSTTTTTSFGAGGGGGQQARSMPNGNGLMCVAGFRPNKTEYHTKKEGLVEIGTKCVKIRRIDVGNAKALRRSIRREDGFAKLAKRALRGSRFKVVAASSGSRRGPRTIVESGAGSVVTR